MIFNEQTWKYVLSAWQAAQKVHVLQKNRHYYAAVWCCDSHGSVPASKVPCSVPVFSSDHMRYYVAKKINAHICERSFLS